MQDLPERFDFSAAEVKVLEHWIANDSFHNQLKKRSNCPRYKFYDGPPFATGLPHYGHILASTIKDIVGRYFSQRGFYVERRFGWDCHGLPIEFEIDKILGIKTKDQVLDYGIANYNEKCRDVVMKYASQWEFTISRLGRWVDFKNDYKSMDRSYMESVWWVFCELYNKGLVYRGYRVMPYSAACGTPLSNLEATLSYKNVSDPSSAYNSVTVEFKCRDEDNLWFLAWTTTPWTLPSNLLLCVNPGFVYLKIWDRVKSRNYIILETRLSAYYKSAESYEIKEKLMGTDLVGKNYEPLFDFAVKHHPTAHHIVSDEYVTADVGTGIVHQSPAFGEDDFRIALRDGVISISNVFCPIDDNGYFTSLVGAELQGKYFKDADSIIISNLKSRNLLFRRETLNHSYPFCWRSDTPLMYKVVYSWFISVSQHREKLLSACEQTTWVPDSVKQGRFKSWLSEAKDWCFSRSRFWGTPLPIWMSSDGEEVHVIGSIAELEAIVGHPLQDIHRHCIDHIKIPSKTGRGELSRVDEVFDCWFESGSLPFAHIHYPFERSLEQLDEFFPADFITEGIDQTRGWFYTTLVISTLLLDGRAPFKNVIASGLILAADGKKMSKRLKNYPDPVNIIQKYGSDSLRLYLINSPVLKAEKLLFKEEGVNNIVSQVFVRWYNTVRFLLQNIERRRIETGCEFHFDADVCKTAVENVTDRWILAKIQSLIETVRTEMDSYKLFKVVPLLVKFIQLLANTYVRFNRNRLKGRVGEKDELISMSVLFHVLSTLCGIMSPFTPFFVETVYRWLSVFVDENDRLESIHYLDYPSVDKSLLDKRVEEAMDNLVQVIELARLARDQAVCPVRQPLNTIMVFSKNKQLLDDVQSLKEYLLSELSFEKLSISSDMNSNFNFKIKLNNTLGARLRSDMSRVQRALDEYSNDQVLEFQKRGSTEILGHAIEIGDVQVSHTFDNQSGNKYHSTGNSSVIVVIDLERNASARLFREIVNRIQRLRKTAGLFHTDEVMGFYSWSKSDVAEKEADLDAIITQNSQSIVNSTNTHLIPRKYYRQHYEQMASCSSLLFDGVSIELTLTRPAMALDAELLLSENLVSTIDEFEDLDRAVAAMKIGFTQTVSLSCNDKDYTFQMNQHIFPNQHEYARHHDARSC